MIELQWDGPFSWPSYQDINKLPIVPKIPGIYLQTFEYNDGYIIYSAGLTQRTVLKRLSEHTRSYRNGDYNIFDIELMKQGIRRTIWQGWGWTDEKRSIFKQNEAHFQKLINCQLSSFRIFTVYLSEEKRILERLEAKIMNSLYLSGYPYSELPDKGMKLSPKRDDEESISVKNNCDFALFGLPIAIEI